MELIKQFIADLPTIQIVALIVFIVIDYVTGIMRALYECKGNSKTHYKGLIKKLGIIIGVIVGALADLLLSGGMPMFTTMVTMLFIANEVLSIIENLGVIGVSMPSMIKERFTQIKEAEGQRESYEMVERVKDEHIQAQEYSKEVANHVKNVEEKEK